MPKKRKAGDHGSSGLRIENMDKENFQAVSRTAFGPIWLAGGTAQQTGTAVFVEGHSLQCWARKELRTTLDADDIRRLISPYVREPFEIHYYAEMIDKKHEKAADKLTGKGFHVHKADRRGYGGPHSEELLAYNARDILPLLKHLLVVCGYTYQDFLGLFAAAKTQGCETTLMSPSMGKKFGQFLDKFVYIKTAVKEMREAPEEQSNKEDRPRVAILSIRPDEEKAILDRLTLVKKPFVGKHGSYKLGKLRRHGGALTVAVKRIIETGNISAQDVARDVIEDLDPDWIVLVGIAGGVPADEYTLGDVIVATRLHDFSTGAYKENGKPDVEFSNRGAPPHPKTKDLIDKIPLMERLHPRWNTKDRVNAKRPPVHISDRRRFYGSDEYKRNMKSSLELHFQKKRRKHPIFWPAPIGGDGYLIKDTRVVAAWLKHARDMGAVEMELAGVQQAATRFNKQYPVICIRGLSDVVGYKREAGWTAYACESAAAFCVWLLKYMPDETLHR